MNERVLITGAAGCLGRQLASMLVSEGAEVTGLGRHAADGPWQRFEVADVRDEARVREVLLSVRPAVVFHAAGSLRGSAGELLAQNALPIPTLCEALHEARPDARLVLAGSSAEYGAGRSDGQPVTEQCPAAPDRPYGVSKQVATQMALAHGERLGLRVVIARLSNLLGPLLSPELAVGSIVAQLAACRRDGRALQVRVGDVRVQRDFLDVEDAGRGLQALARHDGPQRVFNLASGTCHPIGDVLGLLPPIVGAPIDVVHDTERAAVPGPVILRLSTDAAAKALRFAPRVPLAESLSRMWRAATAGTAFEVRP